MRSMDSSSKVTFSRWSSVGRIVCGRVVAVIRESRRQFALVGSGCHRKNDVRADRGIRADWRPTHRVAQLGNGDVAIGFKRVSVRRGAHLIGQNEHNIGIRVGHVGAWRDNRIKPARVAENRCRVGQRAEIGREVCVATEVRCVGLACPELSWSYYPGDLAAGICQDRICRPRR